MSSAIGTVDGDGNRGVLDASAVLAWLLREPGAEVVEAALPCFLSAVNLSEVVYAGVRRGLAADEIHRVVSELPLSVVSFDEEQAYLAGVLHTQTRAVGLSFADCACLNLAVMRNLPAFTAERRWAEVSIPIAVTLIR